MSYPSQSPHHVLADAFLDSLAGQIRELYTRAALDHDGHGECYETVADILIRATPAHELRHRPLHTVADQLALTLFAAHRDLSPHTIEAATLSAVRHTLTTARHNINHTAQLSAQASLSGVTTDNRR